MLYAVKGNKQLKIQEAEKMAYLNQGFDIAEEQNGELVTLQASPNKTVPVARYEALQRENEALKESFGALEQLQDEVSRLKRENAELKKQPDTKKSDK